LRYRKRRSDVAIRAYLIYAGSGLASIDLTLLRAEKDNIYSEATGVLWTSPESIGIR
jgi:hypothetical protein